MSSCQNDNNDLVLACFLCIQNYSCTQYTLLLPSSPQTKHNLIFLSAVQWFLQMHTRISLSNDTQIDRVTFILVYSFFLPPCVQCTTTSNNSNRVTNKSAARQKKWIKWQKTKLEERTCRRERCEREARVVAYSSWIVYIQADSKFRPKKITRAMTIEVTQLHWHT